MHPSTQIIPEPQEITVQDQVFKLSAKTSIVADEDLALPAKQLKAYLSPATGFPFMINGSKSGGNVIELKLDSKLSSLGEEGYKISSSPRKIEISAYHSSGIFYGIQTIRQILPVEIENTKESEVRRSWEIPCVSITDIPRFKWRGLMLDCSRTFWDKNYIKRTIGLMSLYKMNILHLHLTDDQGWRIEIDKYPELTLKGARFPEKWNEPKEREGYYTKADIKEIVEYAGQHCITVVPEIELPGHTFEVLACYPDLSCTGGPFEIHPFFEGPGIHEDILCAGNDNTFEFLENVFTEVFELFPSEFIHIGGDEAPKARWEVCPKCQQRIREEGLLDEHELQSWFVKRIEKFANSKGKKIIGWDEILEGGLSSTANVMYWRGWLEDVPEKVTSKGNNIIMSPTTHCYFDYKYEDISTLKAYSFEPVPEGLNSEQTENVLGVQANFWSHIDRTEEGVDRQLYPRLLSIAEVAWSPAGGKDSIYFKRKVNAHLLRLEELGVNYFPDPELIEIQ